MIFVDNFVHGDLHPGNILVQNHERPIRVRPDDLFQCTIERLRRAVRAAHSFRNVSFY